MATTEQMNTKAVRYGESHIRTKTMPQISQINRDIEDVAQEIAETEKKLNQLKANKRNLEGNLELVPVMWEELQKSIDALKDAANLSDEEQDHHRMLIAVYTSNKNIA